MKKNDQTDLLVLGAGPAGLAAACAARDCGLSVTLVDEQAAPGGQLFRNITTPLGRIGHDEKEYRRGMTLVENFTGSGAKYAPRTTVWGLEPGKVYATSGGQKPSEQEAQLYSSQAIVLAPGGMERPAPFPGWELPGVLGAGAADILLRAKGSLTESGKPVVLCGNGPLLLLLATHLLAEGVEIAAWLDTGHWGKRALSGALMPASLLDTAYMGKGLGMALKILRGRIPFHFNVRNLRAHGDGALERITFTSGGEEQELVTGCLIRHEGVIPRTHILQSLKGKHLWDPLQRCWYPQTDAWGATTVEGIHLAGDGAYVHGGDASQLKGALAGIDVAKRLKIIDRGEAEYRSGTIARELRQTRIARGYLRWLFAPNPALFEVPDETLICRCEAVTAGKIRAVVKEGFREVNEIKLHTRCGMGPCQGRMCGGALGEIAAAAAACSPEALSMLRTQQPFRPVTLENYCDSFSEEQT